MVFPGFLFHHVFLDRDGSAVRIGSRYFQTIEGTFRRRAIARKTNDRYDFESSQNGEIVLFLQVEGGGHISMKDDSPECACV